MQGEAGGANAFDPAQGVHEGTAWNSSTSTITLSEKRAGSFTSPVFPAPASIAAIDWQERWTGPLAWEKHTGNPILTPAEQDAGALSTACMLKDGDRLSLFYGSRPYIRLAYGSISNMSRWERHPKPVLSAGPAGELMPMVSTAPRLCA
jgi:hypothetical protein